MELELSPEMVAKVAQWLGEAAPASPRALDEGVEVIKLDGHLILRGFNSRVLPVPRLIFRVNAVRNEGNVRVSIDIKL